MSDADILTFGARYYSTQDVAALLMESTAYVRREVALGRLACERRIPRKAGRTAYRFTAEELRDYLRVYDPAMLPRLDVPHGTSARTA